MTVTTDQPQKTFAVLACMTCGEKVESPRPDLNVQMISRERDTGMKVTTVWFTRCLACNANTVRAWSYLQAHPRVRLALGSQSYAAITVENALAVLDLLAIDRATVESYFSTDSDMMNTLKALSKGGASIRWSAAFVPYRNPKADLTPGWSFGGRWAHVGTRQKAALRTALGGLLQARVGKGRLWAAPGKDASGCLLCGAGLVEGTTEEMREGKLWFGPHRAQPGVLGGKRTPEPVVGYLCRTCGPAFEQVGAMGPTAMEYAFMSYLGVAAGPHADVEIPGLKAWAALPPGTPPNKTPWDHIADHEGLKKLLQREPGIALVGFRRSFKGS